MTWSVDMQVYSVEAKVNPSQKGTDHAHVAIAWMIARKDVQIVCIPLLKVIDSTILTWPFKPF